MGTHPSGASLVAESDEPLSTVLAEYSHLSGGTCGSGDLPFLFKVLSVEKALSIQVSKFICHRKPTSVLGSS
jgi:mannose-6-phosphate isomerase class I